MIQHTEYKQEIECLLHDIPVGKNSKLFGLHPFLVTNGLLRVGGRLANADIPYSEQNQLIVPPKNHVTNLLIVYEHERLLHAGPQQVISSLRCNYWISTGRNIVRLVLRKCLRCFRLRTHNTSQLMGQLPTARVQTSRPFAATGIDYGGPFNLKIGGRRSKLTQKAYLALFVCMSTKALHLELVSDLTTNAFLAALRRFVSRRGRPAQVHSDNGTNFVGASKELKRFLSRLKSSEEVCAYTASEGIIWNFNPPHSPHFGGLWEAGIKSVKTHLKKIIGMTPLTFEEMYTILSQVEACLNSRPLCALSNDIESPAVLTPGHFLIG
jgi:transposase InsO family protein